MSTDAVCAIAQVFPRPVLRYRPDTADGHGGLQWAMLARPNFAMTLKILLVDDNATYLAAVLNLLGGFPEVEVVGQAHGGREALRLARQLHPDLMLLDVAMPRMNGLEVARAMLDWKDRPRIVFVSMHDGPDYRAAANGLGAIAYIGKSDLTAELPLLLQGLLGRAKPEGDL